MDPVSLAVGAAIFAGGYVSGRIGRARRNPKVGAARNPYVCGCTHNLATHDPKTNACAASVFLGSSYGYKRCACKQYVGERPLDLDLLADQARAAQLDQQKGSTE